ncbi:MAG TPA: hypothetical protein VGV87_25840 [Blastocatellia bacterium]|jgi:hypothetical protein|nr:hypothetical protein [Blastocatellia bacterium]
MKLRSNVKQMIMVFALTLGMSLSLVSAKPRQVTPVPATATVEVATVGGADDSCYAALGVAAGLAIGALSPCSIICAVGAWYVGIGGAALLC